MGSGAYTPGDFIRDLLIEQVEQAAHPRIGDPPADKHHARAAVVRWPMIEPHWRMINMLDAVYDRRAIRLFGDTHDAFHSQQVRTAILRESGQEQRERHRTYGLIAHDAEGR